MGSLQSYAELAWRQVYPNPSDETNISLVEFIETAKGEYAYGVWEQNRLENYQLGENNIPPTLLTEIEIEVKDKVADISHVKAMRSLPNNTWIQQIGEFECKGCRYLIMDLNKYKLLCDDDSRNEFEKIVIVLGKTLRFPDGTFKEDGKVDMVFANLGTELDEELEIDDALGSVIRRKLIDIYSKRSAEDKTNISNGNI